MDQNRNKKYNKTILQSRTGCTSRDFKIQTQPIETTWGRRAHRRWTRVFTGPFPNM